MTDRHTDRLVVKVAAFLLSLLAGVLLCGCFTIEVGLVPPTSTPGPAGPAMAVPTTSVPAPTLAPTPPFTPTPPDTPTPPFTPGPSPTPPPTLCAHARVSGQTCVAHGAVRIESCCPVWYSTTRTDERGAFEFDNLTAGKFTVSAEGRSWEVVLAGCYDQADVNLCPLPTHPPLGR